VDATPERQRWGKLPEIHLLVCTNERPPGNPKGSCGEKGSVALFDAFKQTAEKLGLRGRVLVNRTNCLKPCSYGPNVVVYPAGTWYHAVTPDDVNEILHAALEGRVVERLVLPSEALSAF
jgi:(2Fe-2S) ferredoxin